MLKDPFYDPDKTYYQNYEKGPYGEFANKKVFKQKKIPDHFFLGSPVNLPFGIPAGPLLNSKYVNAALDKAFDIVTYKTVRTHFHKSSDWPNVMAVKIKGDLTLKKAEKGLTGTNKYVHPIAITNSFGVPSFDPDVWQKDIKKAVSHAKKGQVVVGSFQGTTSEDGSVKKYISDFVKASRLVKEAGAKILEANLSCPNEGSANLLCFDVERTRKIVEEIKNEIGNAPLIVKIAYFENQKHLVKLVSLIGKTVDAISAINTIPAKIYDENGGQALPGKNRLMSGVCGYPIKWAGVDMIKRLKKLREEFSYSFEIVGVGGVTTSQDYFEYRSVGADAVMSATGAMWNPLLAQEIKKSL